MSKKTDSKKQLDENAALLDGINESTKKAHDDIKSLLNAISKKDATVTLKDMNDCIDRCFGSIMEKINKALKADNTDCDPGCTKHLTCVESRLNLRIGTLENDIKRLAKSQKQKKGKLLEFACKLCEHVFEAESKEKQIADDETVLYSNCPHCSTYCIIRP